MRVQVIYAGGTIGMVDTKLGLAPGADVESWLCGLGEKTCTPNASLSYRALSPLIDSANATPLTWQSIIDEIFRVKDEADAFVILHGTDTMAYAAAALSFGLGSFEKPVILTGSQLPLGYDGSDAAPNMLGALEAASSQDACGVALYFGGRLLWGARATKLSSWGFRAFGSPNDAASRADSLWNCVPRDFLRPGWMDPKPYRLCDIAVADMVPGISAARMKAQLEHRPEAIIIRGFGSGNIPSADPGLVDAFGAAIRAGVPVVVASQCPQARVSLGRYETGSALQRAGAYGAADMCFEALYAKLAFLLAQGLAGKELGAWIGKPIAGELA